MKLGTNIHLVKKCSISEVKGQDHMFRCVNATVADAYVLTVWRRVSLVLY